MLISKLKAVENCNIKGCLFIYKFCNKGAELLTGGRAAVFHYTLAAAQFIELVVRL